MKAKYYISLDQGTGSSRALLFDTDFRIIATEQKELGQIYPKDAYVEQDAGEIWNTQIQVLQALIRNQNISLSDIAGIGIANQRETFILWDRQSGTPVCNAVVWQDRRSAGICKALREKGRFDMVNEKTGLVLDPYFSATKLMHVFQENPDLHKRAEQGELCFGTVDSWLLWNLTGGKTHATDPGNASRTMLFNIHSMEWDSDLMKVFSIPETLLPKVRPSDALFGYTDASLVGAEIPVSGIMGDQQAALFGQLCHRAGMAKNTYGTGCFLLKNQGTELPDEANDMLRTVAWQAGGDVHYAQEGSVFFAGAAVKWLRDKLDLLSSAAESEKIARSLEGNAGVYFVPALAGLGAPYWDPAARAVFIGMTQACDKRHLVRAVLESVAYQTKDLITQMEGTAEKATERLRVDGGASANDFLMQFQADMLQIPVERPSNVETTAKGAAMMAAVGVGDRQMSDFRNLEESYTCFSPQMPAKEAGKLYDNWKKAIGRSRDWAE